MSRSWKKAILAGLVLVMLLVLMGYYRNYAVLSGSTLASGSGSYENEKVLIHGLQEQDFEVTAGELKKLPVVTKHAEATQSNGVRIKVDAAGPLLETFLQQYGKTQKDFSRIRLTAKDNYSIAVPADILKNRQIVLSYICDGKPLKDEWQPLRIIIPGERSMYWVNNTVRMDFETGEVGKPATKVVLIETAAKNLPQEDYQYFNSVDKAIKTNDLIAKYGDLNDQTVANVYMKAGDGLQKNETKAIFLNAYIKITGEDAPKFLAPQYPQGMHIKELLLFNYGNTAFFDCTEGKKTLPVKTVGDHDGIAFSDIVKQVGMVNAEKYKFSGANGMNVELAINELSNALIYDDGQGSLIFTTGAPANQTVPELISIELLP